MLFLAICLRSFSPDVTPVQPKQTGQMGTPSARYYTAKYSIIFLLHCLFRHALSLQNKPRHLHNSLNLVYYPRSLMAGVYRRKPILTSIQTQFHALLEKGHAKKTNEGYLLILTVFQQFYYSILCPKTNLELSMDFPHGFPMDGHRVGSLVSLNNCSHRCQQLQECCRPSCSSLEALAAPSASSNPFSRPKHQPLQAAGRRTSHSQQHGCLHSLPTETSHMKNPPVLLIPGIFPI